MLKTQKLRILFVIPTLGGGGAEILLGNIIETLHKRGHNILLVTTNTDHATYSNFPNKEFIDTQIKKIICQTKVTFSIWKGLKINNNHFQLIVEDFKPDIIHSHLFEAEILVKSFMVPGIKYFTHFHNNMVQLTSLMHYKTLNKRSLTNVIERYHLLKIQKKATCVIRYIAISMDGVNFLKKNLPKKFQNEIILLPNAISTKRFEINFDRKIDIQRKIKLITVGNLVPNKNHILLIEIAKILKSEKINFHVEIIGYGQLKDFLEKKIKEFDLTENFSLIGNVKNVENFLEKADIYVHTAKNEAFGLAIIEAMASGLPVICLDGKGNRDLIIEGENGYLISDNNPQKFAEYIISLINNNIEYSKISQYCKKFAENYDITSYVSKLIEEYNK
jgi:glycosyltransferase involved in cell wall biosynthesis